jgi:hypothetical protein
MKLIPRQPYVDAHTLIALSYQIICSEVVTLLIHIQNYLHSLRTSPFNVYPTLQVPGMKYAPGHVTDALTQPDHL